MAICSVKGVDIHYIAVGDELKRDEAIIFIHGAGGNKQRWIYQLEAIADTAYGVALDLPGHGQSEGPPCDQVFLYREWVREFIAAMGLSNLIVAGHSMGGAVALDFTLKYPELVRGLILVGSAARFKVNPVRLEAYKKGEYRAEWARESFSTSSPEELVSKYAEESMSVSPTVRYMDFLSCSRFETENIKNIKVPTLIICGTEDMSTPPVLSERLSQQIDNSELVLIENAAHQVMLEQPAMVNQSLTNFLNRV
ncbi:MAG: alpha/beta hydrolase [Dethiobacter sp.]|nr:alpha/beta hydrolase [Dethiobacter sp.]